MTDLLRKVQKLKEAIRDIQRLNREVTSLANELVGEINKDTLDMDLEKELDDFTSDPIYNLKYEGNPSIQELDEALKNLTYTILDLELVLE